MPVRDSTYMYIYMYFINQYLGKACHVDYLSLCLGIPFMNMMILMFTWKNTPGKSETDHQSLTNQPATIQSHWKEPLARSWIHGPVMKRSSSSHISMLKRCGGKLGGSWWGWSWVKLLVLFLPFFVIGESVFFSQQKMCVDRFDFVVFTYFFP